MAATGAFGVKGVNGAALEGGDGVLDEAALVERVGVDHDLYIVIVGNGQAVVYGGRRRAPDATEARHHIEGFVVPRELLHVTNTNVSGRAAVLRHRHESR